MNAKHLQKLFGFVLLAAFLVLICVEGFHHHEDSISHNDCPLCVAAQQTAAFSHHTNAIVVSHDIQVVSCDPVRILISLKDRRPFFVRGPPA